MYHFDPDLPSPPSAPAVLWRYMDLWKYEDLLAQQALFFCRADGFPDPWEGHYTKENARQQLTYAHVPLDKASTRLRATVGVSCWHANMNESTAFWKLYVPSGVGIAIESTVQRLIGSIDNNPDQHVVVGSVQYVDYRKHEMPLLTPVTPLFYKRIEFESDREVRAVVHLRRTDSRGMLQLVRKTLDGGVYVGVDLEKLIGRVRLPPEAPADLESKVRAALATYELAAIPVTRSGLDIGPDYNLWQEGRWRR